MALVAATTLGLSQVQYVRTTVSAHIVAPELRDCSFRLIVQSYAPGSADAHHIAVGARPLASSQRAITSEELAQGVRIDLAHVGVSSEEAPLVVAWVEPGDPDLEFDGMTARPSEGALFGLREAHHGTSEVLLKPFHA